MKLKPLADRVVIQSLETEEVVKGGIILPGSAKEKPQMAEVVAVGPGGVVDGKEVTMYVTSATRLSIPNMPAPKSSSTTRNTSSCGRTTFWQLWNNIGGGIDLWLSS